MTDQTPIRRRFRMSIRVMMVIVLILAGGLGWVAHQARVQREAVAAIVESSGRVRYSFERRNGNPIRNPKIWWSNWLLNLVGVDYLSTVVLVELNESGTDAAMAHVAQLDRIEELYLHVSNGSHPADGRLTNDGMAHVARLTHLRTMTLSANSVGNSGLAHLKGLTGLKELTITMTQATPDGVADLRKSLPKLRLTWYGCTTPCPTPDCSTSF